MGISTKMHLSMFKNRLWNLKTFSSTAKRWFTHYIQIALIKIWTKMIQEKAFLIFFSSRSCVNMRFLLGLEQNMITNVLSMFCYQWISIPQMTIVTFNILFSTSVLNLSIIKRTSYIKMFWKRWITFQKKKFKRASKWMMNLGHIL